MHRAKYSKGEIRLQQYNGKKWIKISHKRESSQEGETRIQQYNGKRWYPLCKVEGCKKYIQTNKKYIETRGVCRRHQLHHKLTDILYPLCKVEGCSNYIKLNGVCAIHGGKKHYK